MQFKFFRVDDALSRLRFALTTSPRLTQAIANAPASNSVGDYHDVSVLRRFQIREDGEWQRPFPIGEHVQESVQLAQLRQRVGAENVRVVRVLTIVVPERSGTARMGSHPAQEPPPAD